MMIKPSEEKRWMKYYAPGAMDLANAGKKKLNLWQFLKPEIEADHDRNDAFIYFGKHIKRSTLIEHVDKWARVLKGMGVNADDHLLIFSPLTPEIACLLFAANIVGATAIFPNLAASDEALADSVGESKVAFVFDGLEWRLSEILKRKQFKQVVLMNATRSMAAPLKQIAGAANWLKTRQVRHRSPKYMSISKALKTFGDYQGEVEAPYKENRVAIVSSSGGTTMKGRAKQICLTNEGMINMFQCALGFNLNGNIFREGTIAYCNLPPFVCTSLFVLLMAPLYRGMVTVIEPRLDVKTFTKNLLKYKPQITLIPGKCWEGFFEHVENMIEQGEKPDLSFFRLPIMGGEGCTPEMLEWMDNLMHDCGSSVGIVSGYGMSEAFSVITIDYRPEVKNKRNEKLAISVGYPFPGFTVGIFDPDGNELPYGHRGELWAKTPTVMKGYLNNPELSELIIGDGWIHSGDYCEMDENGLVYMYGRMSDNVLSAQGKTVYLFDIANHLRQDEAVKHSMVNNMSDDATKPRLVAHLILQDGLNDSIEQVLRRLDDDLNKWLPDGMTLEGYKIHEGSFRMSIVCKVDHNSYHDESDGYLKPVGHTLKEVSF